MPRGQEDPTPLANADTEDSNEESPYVLRCLGATALTLPWKMWGNPMESLENVGKTMGNPRKSHQIHHFSWVNHGKYWRITFFCRQIIEQMGHLYHGKLLNYLNFTTCWLICIGRVLSSSTMFCPNLVLIGLAPSNFGICNGEQRAKFDYIVSRCSLIFGFRKVLKQW